MGTPDLPASLRQSPYTVLLVTLVLLLVLWPVLLQAELHESLAPWVHGALFTLMIVAVFSAIRKTYRRHWFMGLLILGLIAQWVDYATSTTATTVGGKSVGAVFDLIVASLILRRVFAAGRVTPDRIIAAICGYLFIGMFFANLYWLIYHADQGAFKFPAYEVHVIRGDFTYYSFVVMTTLGFGDITPIHPLARSLTYIEATIGQFYIAVVIARLVALEIMHRGRLDDRDDSDDPDRPDKPDQSSSS